ncbi:MAG: alanine:cation symporter family protein [Selenomonadaceae bacterium]|nr:alanine:cation symporter family protein [Selenomonadaceae bacterium]MBQ7723804.1 alanine:cation symporter family protein [Selenomonadaceae bacterium]
MEALHGVINDINSFLWTYIIIIALIGSGVVYTFRTKFVQVRLLVEMIKLIFGSAGAKTTGKEISGFQAFCVSTASRVGVGNIAGVAIAIVTGGPGAVFWMWLIAFIGCATGFVESTLAQIYKLPRGDGAFFGGPAYYMKNALHMSGLAKLFAVLISVTFGWIYVSVQANTIVGAVETAFGIDHAITAVVVAGLTALVIFGGVTRIAKFAEMLVPSMAGLYLLSALVIIVMNFDKVPAMFMLIIHDAFEPQAAVGGGFGAVFMTGVRRGLFSNEAGEGSVPNAAATASGKHPVRQGLIQSFGVYVDTWLVCSATAFSVLLTGEYSIGGELTGVSLVQMSLASVYGTYAPHILAVIVFLFAFSSIVGNYFYGEVNIAFFEGDESGFLPSSVARHAMNFFRVGVIAMVLVGAFAELGLVWDSADLFMGFLCLTNLFAVARLGKYAFIALDDYIAQKKRGVEEPVFDPNIMPDKEGVHAWGIDDKK